MRSGVGPGRRRSLARGGEGSHLSALAAWSAPGGSLSNRRTRTTHGDQLPFPSAFPLLPGRAGRPGGSAAPGPRPARLAHPLQRGPRRWRPARVRSQPGHGARARAGSSEEPPVPGAEDWDFVGQLNRHPHLARKDPALNSRPSCCSEFGVRARPAPVSLGLGPASHPHAIQHPLPAKAPGFLRAAPPREGTRPAPPRPPDSETGPGRVTLEASRPPRPLRTGQGARAGGGAGT